MAQEMNRFDESDDSSENHVGRSSRRTFLAGAAGLAGAAIATGAFPRAAAAAGTNERGYAAGHFFLQLDGSKLGVLNSFEGGNAVGQVVVDVADGTTPAGVAKKHLAGVKYEDITITCGAGMPKDLYAWVSSTTSGQGTRKSGEIVAADFNYRARERRTFSQALITEIGMPALDAASKDAAKMTLRFQPEGTKGVRVNQQVQKIDAGKQKLWTPANFRLRIDGLDQPCSKVNKIEALVVKQKIVENPVGELRDYEKEPAKLEIPNLVISLPDVDADPFYGWHEDFVIKGNCGEDKEKGGALEYLANDLETVLFTVKFSGLGIFKVAPEKMEAGSENIRRVKVEMYCESLVFHASPAAIA